MARVYQAEAPRYGAMGSLGNASYMLIAQYQFPDEYDSDLDQMMGWDHDRIMQHQFEHGRRCFKEHGVQGELGLDSWAKLAPPEKVLAFLKDILKADATVNWTGWRILGTLNRSNGYPVWTLALFAKHPKSQTEVFNTNNAPNLIRDSRYASRR